MIVSISTSLGSYKRDVRTYYDLVRLLVELQEHVMEDNDFEHIPHIAFRHDDEGESGVGGSDRPACLGKGF